MSQSSDSRLIGFAFASTGFLVGNLMGMSASPLATGVVAAVFAFAGGSAVAFLRRVAGDDRRLAARAIVGLTWGCLIGAYVSAWVTEHQWLRPAAMRQTEPSAIAKTDPDVEKWHPLSASPAVAAAEIDTRRAERKITITEAFKELSALVLSSEEPDPTIVADAYQGLRTALLARTNK